MQRGGQRRGALLHQVQHRYGWPRFGFLKTVGVGKYVHLKHPSVPDTRPGKVIRDCDHIYEQLFGYDTFAITGEGCRRFEAKIGDMSETGILCACKTDNCNGEPILDSDVTLP